MYPKPYSNYSRETTGFRCLTQKMVAVRRDPAWRLGGLVSRLTNSLIIEKIGVIRLMGLNMMLTKPHHEKPSLDPPIRDNLRSLPDTALV